MTNSYASKYSYVFPYVTCSVPWASEQGAVLTAYKSELSGQTNMALHFGNISRIKKPMWIPFSNWLPGAHWCLLTDGLKKLKQNPDFSDWWKSGFPWIRTKQSIYCNLSVSIQLFQQGIATLEQECVSGHQNILSTEGKERCHHCPVWTSSAILIF